MKCLLFLRNEYLVMRSQWKTMSEGQIKRNKPFYKAKAIIGENTVELKYYDKRYTNIYTVEIGFLPRKMHSKTEKKIDRQKHPKENTYRLYCYTIKEGKNPDFDCIHLYNSF